MLASLYFYLIYPVSSCLLHLCPLTKAALTATYLVSMMSLVGANTWFYVNFNLHERMQGSNENI